MTARSSATKSDFLKYFTYKLKNLKSLIILNSVFAFLSYPALSIVGIFSVDSYNKYVVTVNDDKAIFRIQYETWDSIFTMFIVVAVIALIGLFFMGLPILMKNFRYLYNKRYVDMDISLPVSDNARFFGDFLSGFLAYTVPHILAIGIGALGITICPPIYKDLATLETIPLADVPLGGITLMNMFLQLSFIGFLSCLLFYCLNLAVVSFCGRGAEARLTVIIVNIALPLLAFTLVEFTHIYYYGVADASDPTTVFTSGAVSLLSPLGMLCSTAVSWLTVSMRATEGYVFTPLRDRGWLAAIIVCIAYVAISYFLMKKRRNERVGSPYMFKGIRHIVSAIISLSVFSVSVIFDVLMSNAQWRSFYYSGNARVNFVNLIPSFVITFIIFIVMELISGKGFKKFHFTLLRYAGCCAGSILICFLLLNSKGFGAEYYVPDYKDVEAVAVSYSQGSNMSDMMRVDNIEEITELHRAFITDRVTNHSVPEPEEYDGTLEGWFGIDYRLKNGEIVSRRYLDVDPAYIDDIARLCIDEGNGFVNEYAPIGDISDIISICTYGINLPDGKNYIPKEGDTFPEELFEALKKDAEKVTFDTIYNSSEYRNNIGEIMVEWKQAAYGPGAMISNSYNGVGYHSYSYTIFSFFENTLKLLSDYGIDLDTVDEDKDKCTMALMLKGKSDYFVNSYYDSHGFLFNIFNGYAMPEEYEKIHIADVNDPILKELYDNSGESVYYGEKDKDVYYVLLVFYREDLQQWDWYTYRGAVFPEYAEKAEAYYNSLPTVDKEAFGELLGVN